MHSVRQRKPPKIYPTNDNRDDDSSDSKPGRFSRLRPSRRIVVVVLALFVIAFINLPAPPLSQQARHWRDSGYFFNYNGHNIFYRDIVRLQPPVSLQPALLIIHGYPTSGYDWKKLVPSLERRFGRIIIPDMLGLGFSDKPRPHEYNTMEQATIMEQLLQSLNVSRVHVLAHDYGDTVLQEFLARREESAEQDFGIESICLTNGGILPSSYKPLFIQNLMILPVLNKIAGRISNWFLFKNRMSTLFGPESQVSRDDLRDFWSITRHKDGNLVLPRIMEYLTERKLNEKRWVGALQRTTIPLHLIYGPYDPINTPERFLASYKELIVNSGVSILENAGHYPQVDNPVEFLNLYYDFLDGLVLHD